MITAATETERPSPCCNLCGNASFTDMPGRPSVRCASCGSLERTRVTALHLDRRIRPPAGARILHFAPERGLAAKLRAMGGENYRALDIAPGNYPGQNVETFDLCRDVFELPRDTYDIIVHNHVLEHIECNYSAVLVRLTRSLTAGGTMLFSTPILDGDFSDSLSDAPIEAKRERFGPMLHVRQFGRGFLPQTLGMIFDIRTTYDLEACFPASVLEQANIPRHHWHKYSGASVFCVGRQDLRL